MEEIEASQPKVNMGQDESSEDEYIEDMIAEGMLPRRFPNGEEVITHDRRHVEGMDDHLVPRILGKRAFPSIEEPVAQEYVVIDSGSDSDVEIIEDDTF